MSNTGGTLRKRVERLEAQVATLEEKIATHHDRPLRSEKQVRRAYAIAHGAGMPIEEMKEMAQQRYGSPVKNLSSDDYEALCKTLEKIKQVYDLAKEAKVSRENIRNWMYVSFEKNAVADLTPREYDQLCAALEQVKAKLAAIEKQHNDEVKRTTDGRGRYPRKDRKLDRAS